MKKSLAAIFGEIRRRLVLLVVCLVLVVVANVYYPPWYRYWYLQWHHAALNFGMRDAELVRSDCAILIERYGLDQNHREFVVKADLPPSLIRLGAKSAQVTSDSVLICLYTDGWGGAWGYLYDPHFSYASRVWVSDASPTWYRDFYDFWICGE